MPIIGPLNVLLPERQRLHPPIQVGPDPAHIHNTHVLLEGGTGNLLAAYRKIHLFDVDVPDGPVLMESKTTAPGR